MNIRNVIILYLLLISPFLLKGQIKIHGNILDEKGNPVIGANVFIEGTYIGSSSDQEGYFSFEIEDRGAHNLVVKFIGYEDVYQSINVDKDQLDLTINLVEEANQMDMITITAGSFEAGGENKRTILKELDIVTTAGATGDIAGVLNTLPGTQTVGEEGKLYVRGGDDYETQTFIDGMRVVNPYHTTMPYTPTRNRFSPFMFKGTSFSTGGYSAEYGQGLSSALILSSKEKADQTRTDLTIIPFGIEAAQCLSGEKTSLAGKIGYFNMKPYYAIIPQNIDWIDPPESVDANLVFRNKIGKSGIIKGYGNFTWSTSQMYQYSIDEPNLNSPLALDNLYGYINTSYKNSLGKKWSYHTGVSYSTNQDDYTFDTVSVSDHTSGGQFKLAFSGDLNSHISLNSGIDIFQRDNEFTYSDNSIESISTLLSFREWIFASFLEADIYVTSDLLARIGIRSEYSRLNNNHAINPRVSLAYKLGKSASVSFACGSFQQSAKEDLLRIVNDLENERSTHYILNYQYINKGKTFRIEGYYKQYENLVKYDPDDMYDPSKYFNTGSGYARGFDVFWRDSYSSLKNVDYWISYSFLDTERDYRDFPQRSIPIFASRHNVSIAYKQFFPKLRSFLSGTYTYASPRPYNDPNSPGFNSGRTKSFHDLSLTVAHMLSENIGLFFMCTNVFGANNVFGYEYGQNINEDGFYNQRAIIPPAKRFILIGVTITLSKNGVMNQLRSL
jgi:hypothetical protein